MLVTAACVAAPESATTTTTTIVPVDATVASPVATPGDAALETITTSNRVDGNRWIQGRGRMPGAPVEIRVEGAE